MKREIKFRAWDGKQMRYPNMIDTARAPYTCYNLDDLQPEHFDTDTLMQFIGIKDKNGKEIYEGDMVRLRANFLKNVKKEEPSDWEEYKYTVEFIDGMFRLGLGLPFNNGFVTNGEIEIIGNVFEHSELLNSQSLHKN